ncbi:cytochrome P450 [Streptomyces litchfieldiae]|uniref:Cytochrome P450 n=1 Tax=Streptomyces litchfieldiae TaxID=3075543 RepID=A0ABU2MXI4_9ACTN|nr:cytochrome P450 [Streptomyces sp. DSM 44938]MDT0345734.1 cytochrome P450 [Streptomyces sp. DSM 44938]
MLAIDLADPQTFVDNDLTDYWRRLRADFPAYWHPPNGEHPGFWVISRYADVMAVFRDNQNLTSEKGNVLVTLLAGGDSASGQMLPVTDGPRHRDLRNVMLKAFSPRALNRVRKSVRTNTRAVVADFVRGGEGDFAQEVASVIPNITISALLGVPDEDRPDLMSWTKSALSSDEADQSPADAWLARNEILGYFSDLVERKRKEPTDDVISALARAELRGEGISDTDLVFNCYSLIIGGDETSRLAMVDAVWTLSRHPEQWRLLREGRVSLDSATEEVLRWSTPAMNFGRTALDDVEVAGQLVRADEIVTVWNISANRDESVFAEPHTFDLARSPNKHLTFGYGPHFCLGAFLGRVEVREVLDALRTFSTGFAPTAEPRPLHSNFMRGIAHLPVRFEPDEAGLAAGDGR